MNITACFESDIELAYDSSSTVEVLIEPSSQDECEWRFVPSVMFVYENKPYYFNASIDQLSDLDAGKGNITVEIAEKGLKTKHVYSTPELLRGDVSLVTSFFILIRIKTVNITKSFSLKVRCVIILGTITYKLPVVRISPNSGYVTSPGFNGIHNYPTNYRGEFLLPVLKNESVFVSFPHFRVRAVWRRWCTASSDSVELDVSAKSEWKKCGVHHISPEVYRGPVKIVFNSGTRFAHTRFKMMYVLLPRSKEPQKISHWMFNCSVPHFSTFKPVLSCNMLTECAGAEDEQNCSFHSEECGEEMIDDETKCYKLIRNATKPITWHEANYECQKHNQTLVTLATPAEHMHFLNLTSTISKFLGVFVGAQRVSLEQSQYVRSLYNKFMWLWVDGRMAFDMNMFQAFVRPILCARFTTDLSQVLEPVGYQQSMLLHHLDCNEGKAYDILCEVKKTHERVGSAILVEQIQAENSGTTWKNLSMVLCPEGHVARDFLSCDVEGSCGAKEHAGFCEVNKMQVPMFLCRQSRESVHFTLVCDHIQHCSDNSDEDFCLFPPCHSYFFRCSNHQCVAPLQVCNDEVDCYDLSDEQCITADPHLAKSHRLRTIVNITISGRHISVPMTSSEDCPATHFLCPLGHCLPVFLRCNGVDDCVGREDEVGCETYACPGFYRCRGSKVCLYPDHVCDGFRQCPQHDDEILCDPRCPDVCQCQGLAFVCSHSFYTSSYPNLRFLDVRGSNIDITLVRNNPFLIRLDMPMCQIMTINYRLEFPNLRYLDLSFNHLKYIDLNTFSNLTNLLVLDMSSNPLSMISYSETSVMKEMVLSTMDLSNISLSIFNGSVLSLYPKLKSLTISSKQFTTITDEGFKFTPELESLDTRDSPLKTFPSNIIRNMEFLESIYVDNYKMCCPAMLPKTFDPKKCYTQHDLLSSCEDLLKSDSYRIFLWVFAFLGIAGNLGSLIGRVYLHKDGSGLGSFGVFVTTLSISDCLMGVYLVMIGASDLLYKGVYLFHDEEWRHSTLCSLAGFISVLSSEVSAFIICLITLDRFLVIRFPFSQMHFSQWSAVVASGLVWVIGLILAAVPLLPQTIHWTFFSQTGICLPLPFFSNFRGYIYSFVIMIVMNFVLFTLIACGQVVIFYAVQSSSLDSASKTASVKNTTIARRLTTIVLSDFLCWFPIGLLGVLASTGIAIPGEVNVAVAIFVLPINSALNPFLYTLNVLKERRQKVKEERLMKQLETRIASAQITAWLEEEVITEQDMESLVLTGL